MHNKPLQPVTVTLDLDVELLIPICHTRNQQTNHEYTTGQQPTFNDNDNTIALPPLNGRQRPVTVPNMVLAICGTLVLFFFIQ